MLGISALDKGKFRGEFMLQIGLLTLGFVGILFLIGVYAPSSPEKGHIEKTFRMQHEAKSTTEQPQEEAPSQNGLMELVGSTKSNIQSGRGNLA